jgi:hypothetical protein
VCSQNVLRVTLEVVCDENTCLFQILQHVSCSFSYNMSFFLVRFMHSQLPYCSKGAFMIGSWNNGCIFYQVSEIFLSVCSE